MKFNGQKEDINDHIKKELERCNKMSTKALAKLDAGDHLDNDFQSYYKQFIDFATQMNETYGILRYTKGASNGS